MKSLLFRVFQQPQNADPFSVLIFRDGTLLHREFDNVNVTPIHEKEYTLDRETVEKLSYMANIALSKVEEYPETLIGWKEHSVTKIQFLTRGFTIEPVLDNSETLDQDYLTVERLYQDIVSMLEDLEPLCFSYPRFFIIDKTKDIDIQIQALLQDLYSCTNSNVKVCILHYFFKTLYWCNQNVYFPVSNDTPLEIAGVIPFRFVWEKSEKELEYKHLPFRDFLNEIVTNQGEAKIAYHSEPDHFWSTDAVKGCFNNNRTLK